MSLYKYNESFDVTTLNVVAGGFFMKERWPVFGVVRVANRKGE